MSVGNAFERRAETDDDPTVEFAIPRHMSGPQAWAIVLAGISLTALADLAVGHLLWFGPFYMLFIGYAAWSLGWRQAACTGVLCIACILAANGLTLYPYGTIAALWNLLMRVVAALTYVGLLAHARNSYVREWRLARTDPLTGALNRQAFFELAETATNSRGWKMLVYADLDGLKKLNDQQGHAVGDGCLKEFVRHVRTVVRRQDIFARIGGDEFLLYMKVGDEAAAKTVATRLHREMNAVAERIDRKLSCSVGVLILPPGERTIDREVRLADQLMYEAKQRGADLAAATLRDVRGSLYLLRHWEIGRSFEHDPTRESEMRRLGTDDLNAAA